MAIIVALFAVAMFILGSMVVESGQQRVSRGDAQNAADAAALAAASVLASPTGTRATAVDKAAKYAASNNFPPGSDASDYFDGCVAKVPSGWQRANRTSCVSFEPGQDVQGNTTWIGVQVVTPTLAQPGLFGAASMQTRALARASITPAPLVSPPVMFGASTSCPDTVEWNQIHAVGDIHSNNDLTVGTGTVDGEGTYRGDATNEALTTWTPAANNPLNVSADEDNPRTYPKTYDIADFRPGGRWATTYPTNFYDFSVEPIVTRLTLRDAGLLTGSDLADGIYYTTGDIRLFGTLNGNATFVSEGGSITVGGDATLTPYVDDLQLFTTLSSPDCSEVGVRLGGVAVRFQGVIYAPEAGIRLGNNVDVSAGAGGSLMGLTVRAIGSSSLELSELPSTIVAGSPEVHLTR